MALKIERHHMHCFITPLPRDVPVPIVRTPPLRYLSSPILHSRRAILIIQGTNTLYYNRRLQVHPRVIDCLYRKSDIGANGYINASLLWSFYYLTLYSIVSSFSTIFLDLLTLYISHLLIYTKLSIILYIDNASCRDSSLRGAIVPGTAIYTS
jgi:hypothetical protein